MISVQRQNRLTLCHLILAIYIMCMIFYHKNTFEIIFTKCMPFLTEDLSDDSAVDVDDPSPLQKPVISVQSQTDRQYAPLILHKQPVYITYTCRYNEYMRLLCQKQVSRVGTSNYIPQYLWDVITCPCPWYLLLAQHSPYMDICIRSK